MVSDERHYDYMARRLREEEAKVISRTEYERAVKELNDMYYKSLIRINELITENNDLKERLHDANIHNKK